MRKISILLSMLVLAAIVLAACGGEETATNLPSTQVPPITAESTNDMTGTATESPTEEATGTAGVPVTGELNSARLTNELDFTVWNQDGEQIGEVDDMVLDLDNTRVAYVVVGTGGFLDLGEREILVPWDCLQLQTGTGDTTGGQQNAFILQTDMDTFRNAPDFDLNANLPQMGQSAGDWDADIRDWCEAGGTTTSNTPSAQETATGTGAGTGQGTAIATSGTGTGQATATAGTGTGQGTAIATSSSGTVSATATVTGTGTGTGTGQGTTTLQGVVLASEVLGSTVTLGTQSQGTDTGQATSTPSTGTGTQGTATATSSSGTVSATATATGTGTGTGTGTATPASSANATATSTTGSTGTGTGQSVTTATIEDMIIDTDSGDILYIVVNAAFTEGERLIPAPFGMFQWNSGTQEFVLNADSAMLQNAPSFEDGQFPDTTSPDWNSEFDTFWQNNGAAGGSAGATATATP